MTREEREEYVIRLYREGRTVRQIAGLVHMSFRDIGAIINKAKLQAERERGHTNDDFESKSPEGQITCCWTLQLTVYGQYIEIIGN